MHKISGSAWLNLCANCLLTKVRALWYNINSARDKPSTRRQIKKTRVFSGLVLLCSRYNPSFLQLDGAGPHLYTANLHTLRSDVFVGLVLHWHLAPTLFALPHLIYFLSSSSPHQLGRRLTLPQGLLVVFAPLICIAVGRLLLPFQWIYSSTMRLRLFVVTIPYSAGSLGLYSAPLSYIIIIPYLELFVNTFLIFFLFLREERSLVCRRVIPEVPLVCRRLIPNLCLPLSVIIIPHLVDFVKTFF